jgi:hypothetical protein
LYLGTENGLYCSFDDGENWQPLQNNLPHAPVYWMVVQEQFNDLVISTYGRGFWILDDLTPLQQMNRSVLDSSAYLFPPRLAYRFRNATTPYSMSDDPTAGQNPPYGASISYYLKSAPAGEVKVRIEDSEGRPVRTLTGTKMPGVNRITWDLRAEQSREIHLRTSPAYAPEIRVGPEGWRPAPDGARVSLLIPPGSYNVKLIAGGQELSRPVIVKKDPNSGGSESEIQAQTTMLGQLRKDIDSAADMVNQIETIRSQLDGARSLLAVGDAATDIKTSVQALDKKLTDIEDHFIQRKLTGAGQDTTRWPAQLISKLAYLASGLSSADFAPTAQQGEVQANLEAELAAQRKQLDEALGTDLAQFNRLLRDRGVQNIVGGSQ